MAFLAVYGAFMNGILWWGLHRTTIDGNHAPEYVHRVATA